MKTGLVLGKFIPFHNGHVKLVEFALQRCDRLLVLICSSTKEAIEGKVRVDWIKGFFNNIGTVNIHHFEYDEDVLPNTSVSSEKVSSLWGDVLKKKFPEVDTIFSSEKYGDFLAAHMNIQHVPFDLPRSIIPVSGSMILADPFKYWDFLPDIVKSFFVKKICISGSESTGKSTLAENLAIYFNTQYVPEMAREVISDTASCRFEDLYQIAEIHARTIQKKMLSANKILLCDTDINITKSYSRFLFGKELSVPLWIDEVNSFYMYLFLENDCPFIQDGTRISQIERDRLSTFHKEQLNKAGIGFISLTGDWQMRFEKAKKLVISQFFKQ